MMSSTLFESPLKRQPHIRARRTARTSCVMSSTSLSVISEEDDTRTSSPCPSETSIASSSSSHYASDTALLKSARRRANIIADSHQVTLTQVTYPSTSRCSSPSSSDSSVYSSPSSETSSLPTSPESEAFDGDDDIPFFACTRPLVIHKKIPDFEDDLDEEYAYYAQEFNKIISLASRAEPTESARPESVCVPSRPTTPPSPRRSRPASLTIVRPPPRMSMPVAADADGSSDVLMYYLDSDDASSSSLYSTQTPSDVDDCASNVSLVDFEFEMDPSVRLRLPLSVPCSPIDLESEIREGLDALHAQSSQSNPPPSATGSSWSFEEEMEYYDYEPQAAGGRVLRSKWSSSTLGSIREAQDKSFAHRMLTPFSPMRKRGFSFRGSIGSPKAPRTPRTPATPSSMLFPPASPARKDLRRRGSVASSSGSSDSGMSDCSSTSESSGLRRKPIPYELFIRQ
ncbi:hypothetical protein CYLTODRAFT_488283 [Cylindrobasidium torrendii FP15055 ss-10]|uniref:Uncharacterized protein n=1 Tax=Cylindrobasidium torrendii FP15055 ss-10 TaxID=1314674 RepID=A0A0D7BJ60_9AGAR|nr:hypothetical protein CYLTODRAFT_488283 [Cylindrobasidium torrendii FP15055 ss-10]